MDLKAQFDDEEREKEIDRLHKIIADLPLVSPPDRHILRHFSHLLVWLLLSGVVFGLVASALGYQKFVRTKGAVLGRTARIYQDFSSAKDEFASFDLYRARAHLRSAYESYREIEKELGMLKPLVRIAAEFSAKWKSYYHLGEAGYALSAVSELFPDDTFDGYVPMTILVRLERIQNALVRIRPLIEKADEEMRSVDRMEFPASEQPNIAFLQKQTAYLANAFDPAIQGIDAIFTLLGKGQLKRYLLLFQNNGEMRPTGGFIGSLALVDAYNGEVKNFFVPAGGSYEVGGGFPERLSGPKPFSVLHPKWEMQDCNWFPDFPTSAKKCALFLEKGFGTSVDGVIAVDMNAIIALLRIFGPISLPEYNVEITAENFIPITQTIVEGSRDTGNPKQFLTDLAPIMLEKIMAQLSNPEGALDLATQIKNLLDTHSILLNVNETTAQLFIEHNNWSGAIHQTSPLSDYLTVNVASINGGKPDNAVVQSIAYSVSGASHGTRFAEVAITRTHTGARFTPDAAASKQERDFNYLTSQPVLNYIRVYAGDGATLISTEGDIFDPAPLAKEVDVPSDLKEDKLLNEIEGNALVDEKTKTRITHEFGKTVFGNYLFINPGETRRLVFRYALPPQISDEYALDVQKQPGMASALSVFVDGKELYNGEFNRDLQLKFTSTFNR